MANVGIAALAVVSIGALVIILLRVAPGLHRRRSRALIGLVPGVVGAGIVGALATDLVPDAMETAALPWLVLAVSLGMAGLIVTNLPER